MRVFSIVTLLGLGMVASGPSVQPEGKRELLPSITVVGAGDLRAGVGDADFPRRAPSRATRHRSWRPPYCSQSVANGLENGRL
jgi:hypothetical protein